MSSKPHLAYQLSRAISIACDAHEGQYRADGQPYIFHPLTVASKLYDPVNQIIAVLHDVLEDSTKYTGSDLVRIFGPEIGVDVMHLTHDESVRYDTYINDCSINQRCKAVKVADLMHNLETIDNITPETKRKKMKDRYLKAYKKLTGHEYNDSM